MFLLLTPDQLLARLATLVPPPRTHGVRYQEYAPGASVVAVDIDDAKLRLAPPLTS